MGEDSVSLKWRPTQCLAFSPVPAEHERPSNMEMAATGLDSDSEACSEGSSSPFFPQTPQRPQSSIPASPFTQFCVRSLSPLAHSLQSPGNTQYRHARILWKETNSPSPTFEGKFRELQCPRRCVQKLDFASIGSAAVSFKASQVPVNVSLSLDEESPAEHPTPPPSAPPAVKMRAKRPKEHMTQVPSNPICCNCAKSRCLKLYCDCFAANTYCHGCKCENCLNTAEAEEVRREAINATLDRNPQAFKPKINAVTGAEVMLKHARGCNCKKSGCLKKYCECFQSGVKCSETCKCLDCRNHSESPRPKKTRRPLDDRLRTRKALLF